MPAAYPSLALSGLVGCFFSVVACPDSDAAQGPPEVHQDSPQQGRPGRQGQAQKGALVGSEPEASRELPRNLIAGTTTNSTVCMYVDGAGSRAPTCNSSGPVLLRSAALAVALGRARRSLLACTPYGGFSISVCAVFSTQCVSQIVCWYIVCNVINNSITTIAATTELSSTSALSGVRRVDVVDGEGVRQPGGRSRLRRQLLG